MTLIDTSKDSAIPARTHVESAPRRRKPRGRLPARLSGRSGSAGVRFRARPGVCAPPLRAGSPAPTLARAEEAFAGSTDEVLRCICGPDLGGFSGDSAAVLVERAGRGIQRSALVQPRQPVTQVVVHGENPYRKDRIASGSGFKPIDGTAYRVPLPEPAATSSAWPRPGPPCPRRPATGSRGGARRRSTPGSDRVACPETGRIRSLK